MLLPLCNFVFYYRQHVVDYVDSVNLKYQKRYPNVSARFINLNIFILIYSYLSEVTPYIEVAGRNWNQIGIIACRQRFCLLRSK